MSSDGAHGVVALTAENVSLLSWSTAVLEPNVGGAGTVDICRSRAGAGTVMVVSDGGVFRTSDVWMGDTAGARATCEETGAKEGAGGGGSALRLLDSGAWSSRVPAANFFGGAKFMGIRDAYAVPCRRSRRARRIMPVRREVRPVRSQQQT
jgi:hypothetical protein